MRTGSVTGSSITRRARRGVPAAVCTIVVLTALLVLALAGVASAAAPFPDVPEGNPYFGAINDLATHGIMGGYQNGNFGPNDPMLRQQFAKVIVLAGGFPVSEADVCPFTDVPVSGPSSLYPDNYVAVCAANGITIGKTATMFAPDEQVTRLQAISMVVRLADKLKPGLLTNPPLGILWIGTWTNDPIHGPDARRAIYNSLLDGIDLTLPGNVPMPRGEVAQILHNLLVKLSAAG